MDTAAEHAVKQLARELESRKSVEVRVRTGITNHGATANRPNAFDVMSDHYIETATGKRFCESLGLKADKVVTRYTHFCDGSTCADVNYSREDTSLQQAVMIKRQYFMEENNDRKQLPAPLLYLYVGREPLYKALPKGRPLGHGEVIGRECDIFLFEQVRWAMTQDQVFYLDKETAIPLKVESFRDAAARQKNQSVWVWTAKTLDRVYGHPVTLKSTQTAYAQDGSLMFSWDFDVESIEFDKDYPASTFWPVLQPGVTVDNAITKKAYQTPGERKGPQETKTETGIAVQPIRAEPPRNWASLAPGLTFGMGCAVLLAAGAVWLRRRGT
jgi:hypothetical protein